MRQLSDFAQCSPEEVTEQHVRQFFLHLKNERHFAYGSLRVAFSGVKFFFPHTCKRDWDIIKMLKLHNITTLPEVLTIEQVHKLIAMTTTQRMFVYFWTVYSMGLRLNEALHLQVGDIDGARGLDRRKTATIPGTEFLNRFLLHVLPQGLMRIRHYGFLANCIKQNSLSQCRKLLGVAPASDKPLQNLTEWFLELTGIDLTACPQCGSDLEVTELAPVRGGGWLTRASPVKKPPCIDSS